MYYVFTIKTFQEFRGHLIKYLNDRYFVSDVVQNTQKHQKYAFIQAFPEIPWPQHNSLTN